MSALICGSYAYDNIMVFHDRFKNHILPDKVHILNVSFLVPDMRREFGGCAGNIAYNLKLLGDEAIPMATVGEDFGPYAEWMDKWEINRKHIRVVEGTYTGQAFITTDMDDNQITAFHPGAMSHSHLNRVEDAEEIKLGIVSPDGAQGMTEHARQFAEANIPFIFDPGQGMPMFDGKDLLKMVDQASWVTLNDYEAQLLQEKTGLSLEALAKKVEALIVTLGGEGSKIYTKGKALNIPAAKTSALNDPTGCGDAYRAGLIHGILHDMEWDMTGCIAALMGAVKIEHHGTQNHQFSADEFAGRFKDSFGFDLT